MYKMYLKRFANSKKSVTITFVFIFPLLAFFSPVGIYQGRIAIKRLQNMIKRKDSSKNERLSTEFLS